MGEACRTHAKEYKCVQNYDHKRGREEKTELKEQA
jgi:hypothetical protein